jgi:valyl-tRNA synthetase
MPGERGLLAVEPWPTERADLVDEEAERVVGAAIEAVTALRRYRDDVGAPATALIPGRFVAEGYEETADQVARLARFELVEGSGDGDVVTSVAIPGGAVQVLPTDAIDSAEAERRRTARIETLTGEIERAEGKLANERFVEKAPADVVQAEREKLEALRAELERLS